MKTPPKTSVNAYDFDHTIYRGDASFDFIVFCLLHNPALLRYLPLQAWAILLYVLGVWDRKQIKQVAFRFLKSLKNVDQQVERFWTAHQDKLEDWYLEQKQASDIIISASPEFLLAPVAAKLGARTLIGTNMNKRTGKITGKNCRAEEKVARLNRLPVVPHIDKAYSDSLSDLPLLDLADNAYIVRKSGIVTLKEYRPSFVSRLKTPAFLRFLMVGAISAFLSVVFAYSISLLVNNPVLAWVIGYLISLAVSYPLNATITFRYFGLSLRQFLSFCIAYVPNFLIQFLCVFLFIDHFGLPKLPAYILAVIIGVPVTFLLLATSTFGKGRTHEKTK